MPITVIGKEKKFHVCTCSTKETMQERLTSKNSEFHEEIVKAELLQLIKSYKPSSVSYVVDEMAKEQNKVVLRLPQI